MHRPQLPVPGWPAYHHATPVPIAAPPVSSTRRVSTPGPALEDQVQGQGEGVEAGLTPSESFSHPVCNSPLAPVNNQATEQPSKHPSKERKYHLTQHPTSHHAVPPSSQSPLHKASIPSSRTAAQHLPNSPGGEGTDHTHAYPYLPPLRQGGMDGWTDRDGQVPQTKPDRAASSPSTNTVIRLPFPVQVCRGEAGACRRICIRPSFVRCLSSPIATVHSVGHSDPILVQSNPTT